MSPELQGKVGLSRLVLSRDLWAPIARAHGSSPSVFTSLYFLIILELHGGKTGPG